MESYPGSTETFDLGVTHPHGVSSRYYLGRDGMKCSECGSGMIGPMDWGWSKEVYGCPACRNMWWPE